MREIRRYQRSTELLIRKLPFARLVSHSKVSLQMLARVLLTQESAADSLSCLVQVRELTNDVAPEPFRWTAEGLLALQEVGLGCNCLRKLALWCTTVTKADYGL